MKSFENKFISNLKLGLDEVSQIRAIGEYKGKEELCRRQSPEALEQLLESAIVQSAESSNRIEGILAAPHRVKKIVKDNVAPRNRPEQEIAGYRDVLNQIHQSHKDIPLSENVVLQFHSMLYRYTGIGAGNWKLGENEIVDILKDGKTKLRFKPVSPFETPEYVKKLIANYNHQLNKDHTEPLVAIPLFVLDFLCIHPFSDGNGRMARLLTLLLLYQSGYQVGKYISLERIIEDSKKTYYEVLYQSSQDWHQGKHDVFPWLRYFYGTLLAAYKEFEERVGTYKGKGSKTDQVKAAVDKFIKPFSISEVEGACPNVTRDMIRLVLRQLRDENKIKTTGQGRSARWQKIG